MLHLYDAFRLKPVLVLLAFIPRPLLKEFIGLFGNLRFQVELFLRQQWQRRWIETAVSQQLEAIGEQRPDDCIGPDKPRILPTQRRHEETVDGYESGDDLRPKHGHPQNLRGLDRPEWATVRVRKMVRCPATGSF